jgi:two-component system OmpR family sensor kinase
VSSPIADVGGPDTTGPAHEGRHVSVRTRVLAAVLLLAGLTVLIAGATSYVLQAQRTDARIDDSLAGTVDGLRTLMASGVDPRTGKDVASVSDVLYLAVQQRTPAGHEGVVALVDGSPLWLAPASVPTRLENDPALMTALAAIDEKAPVQLRTITTPTTQYRVAAVPVTVDGDRKHGLYVVAADRGAERADLRQVFLSYATIAIGSLAIIGVVAWLLVGRLLRPVRLLRDTARRITESDLSERIPVTGSDDLSDLARTVNAMLDRLEGAFGSQRRLLDDVGHELRTPLTIVRGHLELVDPDDPEDVRATRALALDELDRMQRLVEDLMTLATTDRPDFLRPRPTAVGPLTDDVLDKARPLGDRRWRVESRADVTVEVDPQRVTQAWLQLISNAVAFTSDGAVIAIGSRVTDDRLRVWVRDEGPGVDPEDREIIFERFHRVRSDAPHAGRPEGGAGLGLPIVAAIAAAHHGTVRVEDPPHGPPGAVFVLDLPARGLVDDADALTAELVEQP